MPGKAKLNKMIEYIVSNFSGNALTRTKLVKLLYLADRESFIDRERPISNTTYMKYHYGPFSKEIVEAVHDMDGDEIKELSGRSPNGKFYLYKSNREYDCSILTREERSILNNILEEYNDTKTKQLVETVYELDDLYSVEKYTPLLQDDTVNVGRRIINS